MKFILNLIIWLVYRAAFYSRLGITWVLGSAIAKTTIIIVGGFAAVIFIPYWVGLLTVYLGPWSVTSAAMYWMVGLMSLSVLFTAGLLATVLWTTVYNEVR